MKKPTAYVECCRELESSGVDSDTACRACEIAFWQAHGMLIETAERNGADPAGSLVDSARMSTIELSSQDYGGQDYGGKNRQIGFTSEMPASRARIHAGLSKNLTRGASLASPPDEDPDDMVKLARRMGLPVRPELKVDPNDLVSVARNLGLPVRPERPACAIEESDPDHMVKLAKGLGLPVGPVTS